MTRLEWLEYVQAGLLKLTSELMGTMDLSTAQLSLASAAGITDLLNPLEDQGLEEFDFEPPPLPAAIPAGSEVLPESSAAAAAGVSAASPAGVGS